MQSRSFLSHRQTLRQVMHYTPTDMRACIPPVFHSCVHLQFHIEWACTHSLCVCLSDNVWTCLAGPTPTGPESTFNYLVDALLAVPDLRSMYLRRLRSIMDEYTNGKLAGVSLVRSFVRSSPFVRSFIHPHVSVHLLTLSLDACSAFCSSDLLLISCQS